MPKFESAEELNRWRIHLQETERARTGSTAVIRIGMATCGISAGARAVKEAVLAQLDALNVHAVVIDVGCIGFCAQEPLLDIQQGPEPRVVYAHVTPEMVPHIVQEHLVGGQVIDKWVLGRVRQEAFDEQ